LNWAFLYKNKTNPLKPVVKIQQIEYTKVIELQQFIRTIRAKY